MSIKPQSGRRNYAKGGAVKGYAEGGTVWPDASSPFRESLPISGGSANLPGGTMQMGGPGVYDPEHPEKGAQGWSTLYKPAEVPTGEGTLGSLGHTMFTGDQRAHRKPKEALEGEIAAKSGGLGMPGGRA